MNTITGKCIIEGVTFNCEVRSGGDPKHRAYYENCLVIGKGYKDGKEIDGHSFFGDDKFEIEEVHKNSSSWSLGLGACYPMSKEARQKEREEFKKNPTLPARPYLELKF